MLHTRTGGDPTVSNRFSEVPAGLAMRVLRHDASIPLDLWFPKYKSAIPPLSELHLPDRARYRQGSWEGLLRNFVISTMLERASIIFNVSEKAHPLTASPLRTEIAEWFIEFIESNSAILDAQDIAPENQLALRRQLAAGFRTLIVSSFTRPESLAMNCRKGKEYISAVVSSLPEAREMQNEVEQKCVGV